MTNDNLTNVSGAPPRGELASHEQLWEMIERSRHEMTPTDKLTREQVLAESWDAYWEQKDQEANERWRSRNLARSFREASAVLRDPAWEFVSDAICATMPLAIPVIVVLAVLYLQRSLVENSLLVSISFIPIAALVSITAAYFMSRRLTSWKLVGWWRHSGGTFVGGSLLAISVLIVISMAFRHERSTQDYALALAQGRTQKLALSSLEYVNAMGEFPLANFHDGPMTVRTVERGASTVRYAVGIKGLPGPVVAEGSSNSLLLFWENPKGRVVLGTALPGTVVKVSDSRLQLLDSNGDLHEFKLTGTELLPLVGERIAVVTAPASDVVGEIARLPNAADFRPKSLER